MGLTVERALLREQLIRLAREDSSAYTGLVMKDNVGRRFVQEPLHQSWHDHIRFARSIDRFAGILAPWGHGKSSQVLGITTYAIGRLPEIRIKYVCNRDDYAKQRVSKAREIIERDPDFQAVFPGVMPIREPGQSKDEWSRSAFRVRNRGMSIDSTMSAHSVLSTGIGGRCDLLVFDDPLDLRNAVEFPTMREKVFDTITNVWMSRLTENGMVIFICTRWHEEDVIGKLLQNPRWAWLVQRVPDDCHVIESELVLPGWGDSVKLPPIVRRVA